LKTAHSENTATFDAIARDPAALARDSAVDIAADAIRRAASHQELSTVAAFLEALAPADVGTILSRLDAATATVALGALDLRLQAQVFEYVEPLRQVEIAGLLGRQQLARIVSVMSHDERADLWKRLDPVAQEALLPGLAQAERDDLRRLASYPEGTVGSVMTSDYATLEPTFSIPQAIEALRQQALDAETVYTAYVVDSARRLVGVVSLRDLIVARGSLRVEDVMRRSPVSVRADAPHDEAAELIARYDLMALPVLDGEGRLVGIVTQDDAMDVQEAEATAGFHKGGAIGGVTSLRRASVMALFQARVVWLIVLVFGNVFSGAGIAYFEETIAANVVLVFFLPLLIDSGGNAGSQSATLMVRALATGDVRASDWGRMLLREVRIAGLLGLAMALAVSVVGLLRGGPVIALVVACSMVVIVIVGSLVGLCLPFVLSRLRLDPANASAPLVTSIADSVGVLVYFGIASYLLDALSL
jgi:magnesium transporter